MTAPLNRWPEGHYFSRFGPDYEERDCGYETPCWIWLKYINPQNGYGYKACPRRGHAYTAYRVYYEQLVGDIPEGLELDHLCRVRVCVNPAHLEVVTRSVNQQRGLNGKVTPEMRREILTSLESTRVLGRRLGICGTTVSKIRREAGVVVQPKRGRPPKARKSIPIPTGVAA